MSDFFLFIFLFFKFVFNFFGKKNKNRKQEDWIQEEDIEFQVGCFLKKEADNSEVNFYLFYLLL